MATFSHFKYRYLSRLPLSLFGILFFLAVAWGLGLFSGYLLSAYQPRTQSLAQQKEQQAQQQMFIETQNRYIIQQQVIEKMNQAQAQALEKYHFLLEQLSINEEVLSQKETKPLFLRAFTVKEVNSGHYQYRLLIVDDTKRKNLKKGINKEVNMQFFLELQFDGGPVERQTLEDEKLAFHAETRTRLMPVLGTIKTEGRRLLIATFVAMEGQTEILRVPFKIIPS